MVSTIKFSQFVAGGNLSPGQIAVGLNAGVNTKFDVNLQFSPTGDTFQRPATPPIPTIRYNTDSELFEFWNGTIWQSMAAGAQGFTWNVAMSSTQTLVAQNGYVTENSNLLLTYSTPVAPNLFETYRIVGQSIGGWQCNVQTGQRIVFGDQTTTTSSGYIASTNQGDCAELLCTSITGITTFSVISSMGNITFT